MASSNIENYIKDGRRLVNKIMRAKKVEFREMTPSKLPQNPGVYVITTRRGTILKVGRAEHQALWKRIYRNHLMGMQKGNLRAQLVHASKCRDLEEAKHWLKDNCRVQVLEKSDLDKLHMEVKWAEHFLLAVLRPKFSN